MVRLLRQCQVAWAGCSAEKLEYSHSQTLLTSPPRAGRPSTSLGSLRGPGGVGWQERPPDGAASVWASIGLTYILFIPKGPIEKLVVYNVFFCAFEGMFKS